MCFPPAHPGGGSLLLCHANTPCLAALVSGTSGRTFGHLKALLWPPCVARPDCCQHSLHSPARATPLPSLWAWRGLVPSLCHASCLQDSAPSGTTCGHMTLVARRKPAALSPTSLPRGFSQTAEVSQWAVSQGKEQGSRAPVEPCQLPDDSTMWLGRVTVLGQYR